MYVTITFIKYLFYIQVFFVSQAVLTNDSVLKSSTEIINNNEFISGDKVLGIWSCMFTNERVDSPYKEGIIFIAKHKDTYDVALKFSNGILSGNDVVIKNDLINFNVNIEGIERVSFVLLVEGNNIKGESYSTNGSSQILGKRQLPVR